MSKDAYLAAHEREVTEYLDRHPNASWGEAYERTADRAYERMIADISERADIIRQQMKDDQL